MSLILLRSSTPRTIILLYNDHTSCRSDSNVMMLVLECVKSSTELSFYVLGIHARECSWWLSSIYLKNSGPTVNIKYSNCMRENMILTEPQNTKARLTVLRTYIRMNSHIFHWSPSFRVTIDWSRKRTWIDWQPEVKKLLTRTKSRKPYRSGSALRTRGFVETWFVSIVRLKI